MDFKPDFTTAAGSELEDDGDIYAISNGDLTVKDEEDEFEPLSFDGEWNEDVLESPVLVAYYEGIYEKLLALPSVS